MSAEDNQQINETNSTGIMRTPIESDPTIPLKALNSMIANRSGETPQPIEPSVNSSASKGELSTTKSPPSTKSPPFGDKPLESKIFCVNICFQGILTLLSLSLAFSSIFRKSTDLSMERSSYWWYFIFSALILLYLCSAFHLNCDSKASALSVVICMILSVIVVVIELILITRFLFVAFPIPEIHWNLEPIALIGISCLRFVSIILSMCYICRYWNSMTDIFNSPKTLRFNDFEKHPGKYKNKDKEIDYYNVTYRSKDQIRQRYEFTDTPFDNQ